jgi:hypothetical protein
MMASCGIILYVLGFITIGAGGQAILWFGLINLRDCNVGIIDGKDL